METKDKNIKVTIPASALVKVGMENENELQVKVRNGTLVLQKEGHAHPLRQKYLVIWPLIVSLSAGIASLIYWLVRGMFQIPLTGDESVASLTITIGVVTGTVLFMGFFIRNRNDPNNNFSSRIYWRNFPVITIAFMMILAIVLLGTFWVFGSLFPDATFDPFTSFLLTSIFMFFANAFMILAAFKINARTLSTILSVVIISGVVISMASNGRRRWWEYNLSFLGTKNAQQSWQFNVTLIFSALLMIALIDYLFVSLEEVYKDAPRRRLNLLRFLLTLTALDFGAVGLFPNNANFHSLHDAVAGALVTLLVILIIGIRWLLPTISRDFLRLSYGVAVALLVLEMGFRIFMYPSLTAFEIQAFAIAFGWLLLLFSKIQIMINEGPKTYKAQIEKNKN
ncbi:DUF998 domain-containing protein [Pediococcus stilesii]|uniref:ABC transporter permease n=1 Tax=Pediococcus stilesii TaxID=331679 RepID=A0A0R2KXI1_9LACO|nr:DUF998 domain-containing protein [Pediococcus stilesii]KRN94185.1 ABC transporter permease [Pediococcus stilesii]